MTQGGNDKAWPFHVPDAANSKFDALVDSYNRKMREYERKLQEKDRALRDAWRGTFEFSPGHLEKMVWSYEQIEEQALREKMEGLHLLPPHFRSPRVAPEAPGGPESEPEQKLVDCVCLGCFRSIVQVPDGTRDIPPCESCLARRASASPQDQAVSTLDADPGPGRPVAQELQDPVRLGVAIALAFVAGQCFGLLLGIAGCIFFT